MQNGKAGHIWRRSELYGQVSLAAVNQILCRTRGYERLQNSKDLLKACFENVNIQAWPSWRKIYAKFVHEQCAMTSSKAA